MAPFDRGFVFPINEVPGSLMVAHPTFTGGGLLFARSVGAGRLEDGTLGNDGLFRASIVTTRLSLFQRLWLGRDDSRIGMRELLGDGATER